MTFEANHNNDEELSLHPVIYPGFRFALRKAHFSLAMSVFGVITYLASYGIDGFLHVPHLNFQNLHYPEFLILRLHIVFALLEIGYWDLYRRNFRILLEDKRLVVRKGVFRIAECSFPLTHNIEVYLVRSMRDVLLGIWSVHLPTPGQSDAGQRKASKFDGLTYEQAMMLRKILTNVAHDKPPLKSIDPEKQALLLYHQDVYPELPAPRPTLHLPDTFRTHMPVPVGNELISLGGREAPSLSGSSS